MATQIKWKTVKKKLSDLVGMEENPRQMTAKQDDDLRKSLDKFNLAEIPVVNKDLTIIAGHQRIRHMINREGQDFVIEVRIPSRKLTKGEEREYCVRSNKNSGEWDFDKLANNFDMEELKDWGFEDSELGLFDEEPIEEEDSDEGEEEEKNEDDLTEMTFRFSVQQFTAVANALAEINDDKNIALLSALKVNDVQ